MRVIAGELAGDSHKAKLFRDARRSALRVEVRDSRELTDDDEPLVRWRENGDVVETDGERIWCALVAETVARGVRIARVRVVTVPHTEYTRWLLDACAPNIAAGEEVRYLPRHFAANPPADDFWLFDGETVAFDVVDDDNAHPGLAVTTDRSIAGVYADAWERLWSHGVDRDDYLRSGFAAR
ncbi:DUF6879 family protein [Nocardia aobensis]|uniref:DUF6879 family protein n=1 Tax=Nocardia aobensis TaxID=257277 RepID=A0ABW6P341_9NOCA